MFLLEQLAFKLHVATEQDLLSDFNHMLLVVFVLVTELKHRSLKYASQTELHGWKAKWKSIHKHEWWYCL